MLPGMITNRCFYMGLIIVDNGSIEEMVLDYAPHVRYELAWGVFI